MPTFTSVLELEDTLLSRMAAALLELILPLISQFYYIQRG